MDMGRLRTAGVCVGDGYESAQVDADGEFFDCVLAREPSGLIVATGCPPLRRGTRVRVWRQSDNGWAGVACSVVWSYGGQVGLRHASAQMPAVRFIAADTVVDPVRPCPDDDVDPTATTELMASL